MIELISSHDPVLLSALKAALAGEGIPAFELDGPVADIGISGTLERRLMVREDDLSAARDVVIAVCPEYLPPLPKRVYG